MMRCKWVQILLVAAISATSMGSATRAFAQADDTRVDVYLKDADMLTATRALTSKTGLQFVFEPSNEPFGKITLKLDQVTADDAIKYICQAAGASFRRDENGVFIIGHTNSMGVEQPKPQLVQPKAVRSVKRIRLMKSDAQDVLERLSGRIPDPNRVWLAQKEFLAASSAKSGELTPVMNPIQMMSFPVSQQSYQKPVSAAKESGNDILLPGEQANQVAGGGAQAGGGGGGGLVQGTARSLIPPGLDFITYDPTDNSLIVRGTEEDIAELQTNVSRFDVAPRNVIIKVEFITTSNSLTKELGYDFNYQRANMFFGNVPGSFARPSDPIFLSYATGNITMRMRALISEGYGKVVNAPLIRTFNNQPATINSTVQSEYFIGSVVSTTTGNISQFTSIPLNITTGLTVTPRINGDDTITMFMNPTISDFGQVRTSPDGQSIPDRLTQTVTVVARVHDSETIVLGGLNRKSDQGVFNRFPILSDLPIIGQFFRSQTRDRTNSELFIFLTPTIIRDDENGGLGP